MKKRTDTRGQPVLPASPPYLNCSGDFNQSSNMGKQRIINIAKKWMRLFFSSEDIIKCLKIQLNQLQNLLEWIREFSKMWEMYKNQELYDWCLNLWEVGNIMKKYGKNIMPMDKFSKKCMKSIWRKSWELIEGTKRRSR